MQALVHTAPMRLEYVERATPAIGAEDVLLQVKAVAICGSDVHGYTGSTGRRIPPIVMGHEAAGVVEAVGAGVTAWRTGDRVTFDSTVYCNECAECRLGHINLCLNRQIFGVSAPAFRRDGAMADFLAVPNWLLHRIPDGVSFDEAALVEPAAVAMHAARITPIEPGAVVVVVGAGAIGLLALQAARIRGAGTVVAMDVRDERLALARQLGADVAINSGSGDPAEALRAATGKATAPVVFEAVGIGNVQPTIEQNLQLIISKELTIRGSAASAGEYPICIAMIADGRLKTAPLISRTMPLADGQAAFDALHAAEAGLIKIVLRPDGAPE
jgi:L-iditol 2-dehydrogenase